MQQLFLDPYAHSYWSWCRPVLLTSWHGVDSHVQASSHYPAGISPAQTSNVRLAPFRGLQRFFLVFLLCHLPMLWMWWNQPQCCWIPVASSYTHNSASQMHWHNGFRCQHLVNFLLHGFRCFFIKVIANNINRLTDFLCKGISFHFCIHYFLHNHLNPFICMPDRKRIAFVSALSLPLKERGLTWTYY